jgi:hypothetical protein
MLAMLFGRLAYIIEGFFRDFELITLILSFLVVFCNNPFKKNIPVSHEISPAEHRQKTH